MSDLLIRRIVTGHNDDGVAVLLEDGNAPNRRITGEGNRAVTIWCTDENPANIAIGTEIEDMGSRKLGTPPPTNGTRFSITEMPPGAKGNMHRTDSLDYVLVLAGEVELELDNETVSLRAGDVVVQRGTNHRWTNRGALAARVAFIFLDAQPLGIGQATARGQSAGQKS